MHIADFILDKRLIRVNGNEVEIALSASIDEDHDLENIRVTVDYGDAQANRDYLAKFESGELINTKIKVIARLSNVAGDITGSETLSDCHLKPVDYDNPVDNGDFRGRILELLEYHGLVDAAIEDLAKNLKQTLAGLGIQLTDVAM